MVLLAICEWEESRMSTRAPTFWHEAWHPTSASRVQSRLCPDLVRCIPLPHHPLFGNMGWDGIRNMAYRHSGSLKKPEAGEDLRIRGR